MALPVEATDKVHFLFGPCHASRLVSVVEFIGHAEGADMAGGISLKSFVFIAAVTAAFACGNLQAQEVAFIDLTQLQARTDLRRPVATAVAHDGHAGGSHADYGCRGGGPMKGTLRTTLLSLDRTQYQAGDNPVMEVSIENIGTGPLQIPISPHLADLQPADPTQKFSYSDLIVTLWLGGRGWSTTSAEIVELYGRDDHPDTMLTLQPGEWVRIISKGKFGLHLDDKQISRLRRDDPVDHASAATRLAQTTMLLSANASASVSRLECLISRGGPDIPVAFNEAPE